MADSDDEYDRRKGREKFRRERNDYERREERRGRDPRESWDRESRSSGRAREAWSSRSRERHDPYREYEARRRERYSPSTRRDMSPPHAKRMRHDWDDQGYPPYEMGGYGGAPMQPPPSWGPSPDMRGPPQADFNPGQGGGRDLDFPTQPPMLTFKQFLSQQEDNISDQDAIKKYNEYKDEFKRQQINEFFLAHKEEEWFKIKYHPEECEKRNREVKKALQHRCNVYMELMDSGRIEETWVDFEKSDELVKLLDAAVIKMEGGTDFDMTVLDQATEEERDGNRSRNNSESAPLESPDEKKKRKRSVSSDKKPDEPLKLPISGEQKELMKQAQEFSKQQQAKNGSESSSPVPEESTVKETKKPKKKKRHRDKTGYDYESGSESESDSESEPVPPGLEESGEIVEGEKSEDGDEQNVSSSTETSKAKEEETPKEANMSDGEEKDQDTTEDKAKNDKKDTVPKPRALHKTSSIFLRNLAPSITKQEVEAMCKRYPGFVRVALQDPQPERRFFRRAWVTFERDVNIKEICWNLNNIRLRDCELGATLNRELKQRVRPVNGISAHKQVVRADIKQAAKIIQILDSKWGMWEDPEEEKRDKSKEGSFSFTSKNPVLKNITDYLVEEGSFEEEELLGEKMEEGEKESNNEVTVERDERMIKALDRMILYLRIVYSIDYYSANEYPNEDEMPHRCGIMHSRGVPPTTKITQQDVNDWITNTENKLKQFTEVVEKLSEEDSIKFGRKDPEAEVEKFVTLNTQELSKDKWLCPISGKKFKGPEFVRKHIFNKHGEKVDEVRTEVTFFNNYLVDPKRPALQEHPKNKQKEGSGREQFTSPNTGYQAPPQQGMMGYNQPMAPPMRNYGSGGNAPHHYPNPGGYGGHDYRGDYRRSGGGYRGHFRSNNAMKRNSEHRRSDPRGIIEYRDLDAPDDGDIF
ncbi:serrate RNA effector molecule homolog isoform X2 [Crassostrea angulata]|uniref:serrate RNA effector molecule homolog isoform X2 n=1 Tax=Magallana angulata TaxID=2784310 RepID=UPI0022B16FF9|nr:serrate RNA effector molecule homolog isoform X2 [Crassostrea angulata]